MHTPDTIDPIDPIDQLVPPPHPWWVRLVIGLAIVVTVGAGSILWGSGYVFPRPECCGDGGGGTQMARTIDGTAVEVIVPFFNSSGRTLRISGATANLPGANVVGIAVVDGDPETYPVNEPGTYPADVGSSRANLVITFVPTRCHDDGRPWGTVALQLDVVNGWLPSVGRTYTLPNAVVGTGPSELQVWPPDAFDYSRFTTPLAAACALLGPQAAR